MNNAELEWNYFKLQVDLHNFYLDLAIKLNMFYYAITGGILSFYFTNTGIEESRQALWLPFFLSVGLSFIFLWGARQAINLRLLIKDSALELGFKGYPEGMVLVLVCAVFGVVLVAISCVLLWYLLYC